MYIERVSKRYSISEARANLPSVVDEAVSGAPVELTRRGVPVAVVISTETWEAVRGTHLGFADAYARFRDKYDLPSEGLDAEDLSDIRSADVGRPVDL